MTDLLLLRYLLFLSLFISSVAWLLLAFSELKSNGKSESERSLQLSSRRNQPHPLTQKQQALIKNIRQLEKYNQENLATFVTFVDEQVAEVERFDRELEAQERAEELTERLLYG